MGRAAPEIHDFLRSCCHLLRGLCHSACAGGTSHLARSPLGIGDETFLILHAGPLLTFSFMGIGNEIFLILHARPLLTFSFMGIGNEIFLILHARPLLTFGFMGIGNEASSHLACPSATSPPCGKPANFAEPSTRRRVRTKLHFLCPASSLATWNTSLWRTFLGSKRMI